MQTQCQIQTQIQNNFSPTKRQVHQVQTKDLDNLHHSSHAEPKCTTIQLRPGTYTTPHEMVPNWLESHWQQETLSFRPFQNHSHSQLRSRKPRSSFRQLSFRILLGRRPTTKWTTWQILPMHRSHNTFWLRQQLRQRCWMVRCWQPVATQLSRFQIPVQIQIHNSKSFSIYQLTFQIIQITIFHTSPFQIPHSRYTPILHTTRQIPIQIQIPCQLTTTTNVSIKSEHKHCQ